MDLFKWFGSDPKTLVRKEDPDTSHEAAAKVDSAGLEHMVYTAILAFGHKGCISDELLQLFATYPYSSITARYRALMTKGYIEDTGERRKGRSGRSQRVMRAIK